MTITEIDPLLRFVIYKGEKYHIARCLEHDFAVQLIDPDCASQEITHMIAGQVHIAREKGVTPFANMSPAPEEYQKMKVVHAFTWR